ncbi:MAG: LysR family transcriptional regulator, partial [Planctomycetota bacterium]
MRQTTPAYKSVTFPQLRSFCEVAKCGSMQAAARSLKLAQPTVWKQIDSLERSLDAKLFDRHPSGVELTDAGKILLRHYEPSVRQINGVESDFPQMLAGDPIPICVAASPRTCQDDLASVMKDVLQSQVRVDVRLTECDETEVVPRLEDGSVDLAFADRRWARLESLIESDVAYL